ncbi:hypothetical protein ABEW34_21455 [Paenibacillus algorifonticola]|uniref:hypothetical protein n=1 Tax=Paenibacillus algorifonticola TaxID=684063 RepID=UPI003D292C39
MNWICIDPNCRTTLECSKATMQVTSCPGCGRKGWFTQSSSKDDMKVIHENNSRRINSLAAEQQIKKEIEQYQLQIKDELNDYRQRLLPYFPDDEVEDLVEMLQVSLLGAYRDGWDTRGRL